MGELLTSHDPGGCSWLRRQTPLLLLLGLCAILHGRSLWFPFVNWDDPVHVYRNRSVVAPEEVGASERWFPRHLGYPMPLVIASYRLDRAIWGPASLSSARPEQGRGYHATNLVLALALIALVHLLCRIVLTGASVESMRARWAAAAGASLFALHPIAVEPIVWVSGRKDVLAAIGCVGAAIFWLRLVDGLPEPRRRIGAALGFLGAGLVALASKPNAVMLLPLAAWSLTRGSRARPRSLLAHAGCALASFAVLAALVTWLSLSWQRSAGALASHGIVESLRRAVWALGCHLELLLWPVDLRAKYLIEPTGFGSRDLLAAAAILGLLAALVHPKARRSAGAFGAAFFGAAYLPQSNLVPLQRQLADSYMFLPLVGVAVAAAAGFSWLAARRPWFAILSTLLVAGLLAVLAARQIGFWSSSERLWQRVQRYHPDNAIVCRMLGEGQIEAGQPARAIATYQGCISRFGVGPFANNLGIAYFLTGDHPRARQVFEWILARRPGDPRALKYLRRMGAPGP